MSEPRTHDVIVVGGGPGGSAAATVLADGGRRVALVEREPFPRFHVGESLIPASGLVLKELGVFDAVEAAGFQLKFGAGFVDHQTRREQTFYFLRGMPWPHYTYQVRRSDFDTVLLNHARKRGVQVIQPATVVDAAFDADGVTVTAEAGGSTFQLRAAALVDASGRDSFLATRLGRRTRIPNLGKVALFAHWDGADRLAGQDEGNIRIFVFDEGWFWWIPFAGTVTSVGGVLHARTVRAWHGTVEELYAAMIQRCPPVAAQLAAARRVTEIHRAANFSYRNSPVVGDRFLAVGDAVVFVDPIFSGGVFIALRTGQMAGQALLRAFADGRFTARRFRPYERAVRRGVAPLFRFIHKYYEPAFFDLLLKPSNALGMTTSVLNVLSGGSFIRLTWRTRVGLASLFTIARINRWVRRRAGQPVESRLEW